MQQRDSLSFLLLLCLLFAAAPSTAQQQPEFSFAQIGTGFGVITDIKATPSDPNTLYIVSRSGLIRKYPGAPDPETFLDIEDSVRSSGERGLLGLAFHPEYASNGFFFVHYSDNDSDSVIARFTATNGVADPSTELILATIAQPFNNHNGGQLAFRSDGFLYIGLGDGGSGNDPEENSQDMTTYLGKILRVDVDNLGDSEPRWSIPVDNPFSSSSNPVTQAIWVSGVRNPWCFSFDRQTEHLYIADVGQNNREWVLVQDSASMGGENYGWGFCEGTRTNTDYDEDLPDGCECGTASTCYVAPKLEMLHGSSSRSITGGHVYRGPSFPNLQGLYIFADFIQNEIYGATTSGSTGLNLVYTADGPSRPTKLGEDVNGEIYLGTNNGVLYKMREGPGDSDDDNGDGGDEACFSGANTVRVNDSRGEIHMRDLRVGDYVQVAQNDSSSSSSYSRVISFAHYHDQIASRYLQIVTSEEDEDADPRTLEISPDHLLYASSTKNQESNKLVRASAIQPGHWLVSKGEKLSLVHSVTTVVNKGVYAPITESGDIVVSGILCSSYIGVLDNVPVSLQASVFHSMYAPLRWVSRFMEVEDSYNDQGIASNISVLVNILHVMRRNDSNSWWRSCLQALGFGILAVVSLGLSIVLESSHLSSLLMGVVGVGYWKRYRVSAPNKVNEHLGK